MNDNYSTMLSAIAEAGNDDLFARWCLGVEIWNDEKVCGQERAVTLDRIKSDAPRLAKKTYGTSASISQLLRVVGYFRSYDDMMRQIDKSGDSQTFATALKLTSSTTKPGAAKASTLSPRLKKAVKAGIITEAQAVAIAAL